MKLRVLLSLLVCVAVPPCVAQSSPPVRPTEKLTFSPPSRTFRFTYSFTVKDIPAGTKVVRVWFPQATRDRYQDALLVSMSAPAPTRLGKDPEYGNVIVSSEIHDPPAGQSYTWTWVYEITRREYSRGDYVQLERKDSRPTVVPASMTRYVQADTLIPTDGKIKALAEQVTVSQPGTVAKAKAAYDYFFTNFRYDKTGTGWGRGDAVWACDSKHGNCTDFHSPFIGVLRADGIPARFDIGFPIAENKDKGDIAGYHCWAEFYAPKIGWIPVDISEAWKAKEKENYFFGSVDANRVQLSTGRDITLSPKQDGAPLNYFVYPYVELDGKPYEAIGKQFSFEEVKSVEQRAPPKAPVGSPGG